jgi:hypothetical protein
MIIYTYIIKRTRDVIIKLYTCTSVVDLCFNVYICMRPNSARTLQTDSTHEHGALFWLLYGFSINLFFLHHLSKYYIY